MGMHLYDSVTRNRDVCRTPNAVYSTAFDKNAISLHVKLPVDILKPNGPDEQKLVAEFHNAILSVVEKLYKDNWDKFKGRIMNKGERPLPDKWEEL
ncbi:MAG: hypothetical protein ACRYGG_21895 [Janthinobacterium lividum]